MKRLLLTLILGLAACSGGGGASDGGIAPPTVGPTATPVPVIYTATILWTGILAGNALHAATADKRSAGIATSTGRILTVSGTSSINGDPGDNGSWDAIVQTVVAPAPSTSPSVTYSADSNSIAVLPTPVPRASASPQPPSAIVGPANPNTPITGKNVVATIGGPVNTTVSQPIIAYQALVMVCGSPQPGQNIAGVRWNGTSWVNEPDPTLADFYLTYNDPTCGVGHYTPGVNGTINYPGGGKWFSDSTALDGFATTDWANVSTSESVTKFGLTNPDGSYSEATLLFKTRGGVFVKVHWLTLGSQEVWAYEVSGQGLDGF